jgi:hypothetical protein
MIFLRLGQHKTAVDARRMLQTAINVEFATLPPYLYPLYSIRPGTNPAAAGRLKSIALQEMIHMTLVSNILNALGGHPNLHPPVYPGPLPGDIGPGGVPLVVHILPFSRQAMEQGMAIETPENPIEFPIARARTAGEDEAVTIGQFYAALDELLSTLPATDWTAGRNQIIDNQFFAGQLFPVNNYVDAHNAIEKIVSEGEGTANDPLDFQGDLAHYYRFGEIFYNKVLTKANNPQGYTWGPAALGVDWDEAYPAIPDPGTYNFANATNAARAAQAACNAAYTAMVDALQLAVTGKSEGALGNAVRAMFDLRMATRHALTVPLIDGSPEVAGPAFLYTPSHKGVTP